MSIELQNQAQAMASLTDSMQKYMSASEDMSKSFKTQLDAVKEIEDSLKKTLDDFQEFNSVLENVRKNINTFSVDNIKPSADIVEKAKGFFMKMFNRKGELNFVTAEEKKGKITDSQLKKSVKKETTAQKDMQKSLKESRGFVQSIKGFTNKLHKAAKDACESSENIFDATKILKDNLLNKLKSGGSEVFDKLKSLAFKVPFIGPVLKGISIVGSAILGVASVAWNIATTSISVFFNLTKTVMTLPFTIAGSFIDVGNVLRTKVIEGIGNQVEAFKDEYNLDSYVGQKLKGLGTLARDAMLELQDNKSKLTRIYGFENPEAILTNALENTKAVGNFAEYLGSTMNSSIENAMFLVESQRALGIGASELKYYALESFTNVRGLQDVLMENIEALQRISKKTGSNFKLLSREFHKLRLDIVQFGHLSAGELAEVSAEILRMKISAEDVVGIFSKISSFEDAANMSAQLFQAFGMTVDAFDMVSARDPIQIIKMLKDGMLNTGKSFDVLNRHEKALLKQLTGLSDQSLKTTFSYKGLSMSQEELRKNMEKTDPFEMMTDSMRNMSSAIRSIIKVMNFNSPFDALYKGLMESASLNKEFTEGATNISEAYESLERAMLKLDDSTISAVTRPLNIILKRFHEMLTDGTIANLFKKGVTTIGNFFTDVFAEVTDSNVDNQILDFEHMLSGLSRITTENAKSLTSRYTKQFRDNITGLMAEAPNKIKDLLGKHNLLDEKGNLRPDAALVDMRNALVTAANSSDQAFANQVQKSLNEKFNTSQLKSDIENLEGLAAENKKLQEKILDNTGINRITNKLFEGISTLVEEGAPLFTGIFNLGASIMSGFIKGSVMGLTAFLNLINNKVEDAAKVLGESVKEENYLPKLLGFKDGELSTITDALRKSTTELASTFGEKLPDLMSIIYEKVTSTAGDLKETVSGIIAKTMLSIYEDPNVGDVKRTAIYTLYGDEINSMYIKRMQQEDSFQEFFKNNFPNDSTTKYNFAKYLVQELKYGSFGQIDSFKSIDLFKTFLEQVNSGYLSSDYKKYERVAKLKNDIIKLHDSDILEVVASKPGGLLMDAYREISKKYNQSVEEVKVIARTKKALDRSEINFENDEMIIIDLLTKVDSYIDTISNKKPVEVCQNNIKFMG